MGSHFKITPLCNNTTFQYGLRAAHGWSALIEQQGKKPILFDAGPDISIVRHNANQLGINLDEIEKIFLSHGHIDHTGGLAPLLAETERQFPVYAHPDIFISPRFSRRNGPDRSLPNTQSELESLGAIFHLSTGPTAFSDHILSTGQVKRKWGPSCTKNFYRGQKGNLPDEILDDQSMIFKTEKGLVLLFGCGHAGLLNTIMQAKKLTGDERIFGIIGGIHQKNETEKGWNETLGQIRGFNLVSKGLGLRLSHCTGIEIVGYLKAKLGNDYPITSWNVGESLKF